MGQTDYTDWLSADDRLSIVIQHARAGVDHYCIQYDARFSPEGEWESIRRYDCSHGHVHVHTFRDGQPDRVDTVPGTAFKDGLGLPVGKSSLTGDGYAESMRRPGGGHDDKG